MNREPLRSFTRGIPEAVEQTPAFVASLEGGDLTIPQTWGNVASAIIERGIVEPNPGAMCDFLGINEEDLRDPGVIAKGDYQVDDLAFQLIDKWTGDYAWAHKDDTHPYKDFLLNAKEQWAVEDNKEHSKQLRDQLDALRDQERAIKAELKSSGNHSFSAVEEATRDIRRQRDIVDMQEAAYAFGYVVSLPEFAQALFSDVCLESFSENELTRALNDALQLLINVRLTNAQDLPASQIVLGLYEIDSVLQTLHNTLEQHPYEYGQAMWDSICDLFIAPMHTELALFAGNEK